MPLIFLLLWSSGYLFSEMGLEDNNPISFLMLRLLFACLIMGTILLCQRRTFSLTGKQIAQMSIIGIFIQGFYPFFSFSALYKGISPGVIAIVLGTQPIITALILREQMSFSRITGLILGIIGLTLTVSNVLFVGSNSVLGIFCCFLSLFGITVGTILQKKYGLTQSLTLNLFIQYLASFLFIFVLYLSQENKVIQWSEHFIVALGWMVLVVSIISTLLFNYLLKSRIIVNFTSYLYCVPPVTALMDYLVYHHTLSQTSLIGMIMVILGLVLILKNSHNKQVEQSSERSTA
ncbi:DMT family transporter [Legionella cardiaca]|uniref:DMT family transporter n=1 Tax=Legionella cardiaca TaxID=1071983 RepID=A0ABY8AUT9_9GAMM|nr:DMT family transporter [Legionella cardiaca]WED43516.1 DMT family transporter [Legionella cardiaca]